ncbi:MAG TPA: heavy metal translocating P-type ATPase [Bacillota bacterium]|nr:heavy metal translocating P-type ATPase [Bacillota bacterium]
MKKDTFDIIGMHCAACSSAVERVTRKLLGVVRSEVNLPMNRLTVEYDETLCTPEALISKVKRAGFTAVLHAAPDKPKPAKPDRSKAQNAEKRSLIVSCCFAGALLMFSMGTMLFSDIPLPDIISADTHPFNFALVQLLLCVPVLFLGRHFFTDGFSSLFHGVPNMDTLVALSASASFIYSVIMTFLVSDNAHALHGLYYESAAVVIALVSLGKYLESASKERTKGAITKLMTLTPDTAVLVDENGQWEVPTNMIKVGDTILVKPGARVPLDGTIIEGSGSVNEAMLTGESLPVEKTVGDEVIGGSVSVDGALYVRVTRIGGDTTLAKIIRFVEDAQGKKAPISRAADKVAGVFVPIVTAVAFIAAAVWLIAGEEFTFALRIFTCILVIACPCAMGLATPTAIIVGTGLGAQNGILIRSGEALETTHKVGTVIFDKTGTLTKGVPAVTDALAADGDMQTLLSAALSLEMLSAHPLADAVRRYCQEQGAKAYPVSEHESIAGKGLAGTAGNERILAGNAALMSAGGIDTSRFNDDTTRLTSEGKTVVTVAKGDKALGIIALADTIKPDAAEAVAALRTMGIKTVLLTGDNRAAAEFIGTQAGVDAAVAEVLPTEKAAAVEKYQKGGETVMMVGDGINDAPALTQADVGCAMGGGSDIAVDSADIVLMKPELTDVCRAIKLSRLTIRNIRQNLFWAFCYNVIGIPIAAGALYPAFGLLLSPMIGALAMSLSSLFVVTNALRLKGKKL